MNIIKIKQQGFSLIEIAVVMAIIGILIAGGIGMISAQREGAFYQDSQDVQNQAKQALLAFVKVNKYLPCPDTTGDGRENRNANHSCVATEGDIPFLDLGLRLRDIKDGFNGAILYAVNQQVTILANMQDSKYSASFFCNTACANAATPPTNVPRYNLTTPPIASDIGVGNLSICSDVETTGCTGTSNKEAADLSVVLVAFNQRGKAQVACSSRSIFERENCNNDELFWNALVATKEGAEFDDFLVGISGYEIKKVTSGLFDFAARRNTSLATPPAIPVFMIANIQNPDNIIIDDFHGDHRPETEGVLNLSDANDSSLIQGDVLAAILMQGGDNQLQVNGDVMHRIDGGNGNDTVRVGGDLNQPVTLKGGDDKLEVRGDSNHTINMGTGNDIVYVHGNITQPILLGAGNDFLQIDGEEISSNIDGGLGNDTLRLQNYTTADWRVSNSKRFVTGFEAIICTDGRCGP